MTHLREHWEGVCLAGNYTLDKWLGGNDAAAFFQTSPLPDGRPAVVKLVPEAAADGDAPLELWHRTRQLRHPNLIELFDCGRSGHGGDSVLYAVFEAPDETLANAIGRSPLNPQEAREVLHAVLTALRYLHAQGLVLGALDPDHIVAVGDRIKLSTGALRDAGVPSAYREDVRLLGELWRQTLMSASPKSEELAAHAADPDPQSRWTLAEIAAALDDAPLPLATSEPEVVVATPAAAQEPAIVSAPAVVSPPVVVSSPVATPPIPKPPVSVPLHRAVSAPRGAYPFPMKWIFAAAAVVVLLILALNRPHASDVATASPATSVSLPPEAPAPTAAPPTTATVPVEPKPSPSGGRETWRVIAFTYRTRDAASRKVEQLNQYHPGLNAAIFSPKDKGGYYMVALGGRMTHEEAVRLQRSARGKGLPRDLYVQNYSE
jgi:hypothetical protein